MLTANGDLKTVKRCWLCLQASLFAVVINASVCAYSLQDLWSNKVHASQSIDAQPQIVELNPITREGLDWARSLGNGIQADGRFNQPISVQSLYGINSLPNGSYRQRFQWDADVVQPRLVYLRDRTRYFMPPANSVRGWQNGRPVYYQFHQNSGSIVLNVQNNQVTSIHYCFGNGTCR